MAHSVVTTEERGLSEIGYQQSAISSGKGAENSQDNKTRDDGLQTRDFEKREEHSPERSAKFDTCSMLVVNL